MKNLFGEVVKVKEADVLKAIQQYLTYKGIFYYRNNSGAYQQDNRFIKFGKAGSADLVCIYPGEIKSQLGRGLMWMVEVKKPGGILSPAQIDFLKAVRAHGGIATVAESVDDVERTLIDLNHRVAERYEQHLV